MHLYAIPGGRARKSRLSSVIREATGVGTCHQTDLSRRGMRADDPSVIGCDENGSKR